METPFSPMRNKYSTDSAQILIVFCEVGWIINRCPLSFELPSAVTRWKISGYFCQNILTSFLKRLFFRQHVLKSNPGKTAAAFSEPSKAPILLIIFFFPFLLEWKLVAILIHPVSFKNCPGCKIRISSQASSAEWFTTWIIGIITDGIITVPCYD